MSHAHLPSRREFCKLGLAAAAASALLPERVSGIEPVQRRGSARLATSLAAYSFRQYFQHKDPAKRITLDQFVDFCADQGLQATELTSYYFPQPLEPSYLVQIKRHAFLRGLAISGTSVGNNFVVPKGPKRDQQIALVKQWIDHAAVMGAPHVRVFAGSKPADLDLEQARALCITALEECCDYAGSKGVFLGLENHGGIVAKPDDMLDLVRAVKSPWLGINLDTGNFQTDDPYADLARCVPYAVNVQWKVEIQRRGGKKEVADLSRLVKMLRDGNYQGYLALEYESAEDPWTAVPRLLKQLLQAVAA